MWDMYDSPGQILALACRAKSLKRFKLFRLRAAGERPSERRGDNMGKAGYGGDPEELQKRGPAVERMRHM